MGAHSQALRSGLEKSPSCNRCWQWGPSQKQWAGVSALCGCLCVRSSGKLRAVCEKWGLATSQGAAPNLQWVRCSWGNQAKGLQSQACPSLPRLGRLLPSSKSCPDGDRLKGRGYNRGRTHGAQGREGRSHERRKEWGSSWVSFQRSRWLGWWPGSLVSSETKLEVGREGRKSDGEGGQGKGLGRGRERRRGRGKGEGGRG